MHFTTKSVDWLQSLLFFFFFFFFVFFVFFVFFFVFLPILKYYCTRLYELHREKTGILPMRKQRRRSAREADQRLCFRYTDSTLPLLLKSEISSF